MANLLDYLNWRGDLSLDEAPFNEVDNLILSQLSYIEFQGIVPSGFGRGITIREAAERYLAADDYESRSNIGPLISAKTFELLRKIVKEERFAEMRLSGYVNQVDEEHEKQFAAMTVQLPDDTIYVAFRGTDSTLVGWKEDFNMSFLSTIPSQTSAVEYLAKAAAAYPNPIRTGGHSKGGNLAVYGALFSSGQIQKRLLAIYNNDGPGLTAETVAGIPFSGVKDRIHTIIPKSSIVGMLLEHSENYEIVDSTQVGIFQHDPFSWQVMRDTFVKMDNVSDGSQFIDKTLREWIEAMDAEQKEQFVDGLFEAIEVTNSKTLNELSEDRFKKAVMLAKSWKNFDENTKKVINQTIHLLFQMAKKNLAEKPPLGNRKSSRRKEIK